MTNENKTSENTAAANVPDLIFKVVYEDKWLGGLHVVGEYTDAKEADDVAERCAAMDNAETVLIYVRHSDGKFVGTLTVKQGPIPHADM